MHPYATNSTERRTVIALLVIASIFLAYALAAVITEIQNTFHISLWWLDAPAVFGFFGILYAVFNRWLWQLSILHSLGLVKVPNLNGNWSGELRSSYEGAKVQATSVRIDQSWTELCVELRSDHSRSDSVVASILFPKPGETVLTYQYMNEPRAHAADDMHAHRGTAWLCFRKGAEDDYLEGEYYSGRDRQNIGSLKLRRVAEDQSKPVAEGR